MKNCTQKNKYYKVALRFTFVTIAIIISSGLFRIMMEKDYFTDSMIAALAFADYCASKEAQTIRVQFQGAVSGFPAEK